MPPFPKPKVDYTWDVDHEVAALRDYPRLPGREDRALPPRDDGRVLLATWNIANLGVQERRPQDYRLLAEVISWFHLIALQEVNDDLRGLRGIQAQLPEHYRVIFSDPGGNHERFAFVYDSRTVAPEEEMGELTIPANDLPRVRIPEIPARFVGFDRNPMLASFRIRDTVLLLADVHLYFGKGRGGGLPDDEAEALSLHPAAMARAVRQAEPPPAKGMDRRLLEAFAVAWWADQRNRDKHAYTREIVALGDFNLPRQRPGDRVYDALTRKGLTLPSHSTHVGGSNIRNDSDYDQMAVLPGPLADATEQLGIFDFDGAVFRELWGGGDDEERKRFFGYVQYYLSDHRPLWMALKV